MVRAGTAPSPSKQTSATTAHSALQSGPAAAHGTTAHRASHHHHAQRAVSLASRPAATRAVAQVAVRDDDLEAPMLCSSSVRRSAIGLCTARHTLDGHAAAVSRVDQGDAGWAARFGTGGAHRGSTTHALEAVVRPHQANLLMDCSGLLQAMPSAAAISAV